MNNVNPASMVRRDPVVGARPEAGLAKMARGFCYRFQAMASPCEVRIECEDEDVALAVGRTAQEEAARIEAKYSRYRNDSVVGRINASGGEAVEVDGETARLLDFAARAYSVSGGLFDITSGVLRRIWRFDGSDRLPSDGEIKAMRQRVGWHKLVWQAQRLTLPVGMEIDLGGIGKEYAVDCALLKISAITPAPVLVNFGGDLRVSGPRAGGERWRVAIENVDDGDGREGFLEIAAGALTTSGDARRFLLKDGVRYSHILNPRTGRPVKGAPRSVTVAAPSCIEAGLLSTLAMLRGRNAASFLKREGIQAWVIK